MCVCMCCVCVCVCMRVCVCVCVLCVCMCCVCVCVHVCVTPPDSRELRDHAKSQHSINAVGGVYCIEFVCANEHVCVAQIK